MRTERGEVLSGLKIMLFVHCETIKVLFEIFSLDGRFDSVACADK